MTQENIKTWEITVETDPVTGDLILPLPAELIEMQGWKNGDELEWIDADDGSYILQKP